MTTGIDDPEWLNDALERANVQLVERMELIRVLQAQLAAARAENDKLRRGLYQARAYIGMQAGHDTYALGFLAKIEDALERDEVK